MKETNEDLPRSKCDRRGWQTCCCKHRWLPVCAALAAIFCASVVHATVSAEDIADAALERTQHDVRYDGAYRKIAYPLGDVPADVGVCTDVVIRAYRAVGIDLQALVHRDISEHFTDYPSRRIWGLTSPDSNIDHRRVPNLQAFFSRHGQSLPISRVKADYQQGDIVTWMLAGNLPHIGIIVADKTSADYTPLVVHNIGAGPKLEDILFAYPITGHYRYAP